MAIKHWVLTDVESDHCLEELRLGPDELGSSAPHCSIHKKTLHGGRRHGVDVVEVRNGRLQFVVVPTRGMSLWRGQCDGVPLGWNSPVQGPVHPSLVPLWAPHGIGWLEGFDEWLVRCGLESNGAPEFAPNGSLRFPLHGKIGNTPAHRVEIQVDDASGEIALVGVVDEGFALGPAKLRMTTTIRTRVGSCELSWTDEIQNLSAKPGELELLYHTNFGPPLAAPGATISLPIRKMAPRDATAASRLNDWNVYEPATPGVAEACYFFEPLGDSNGRTRALLRSSDGNRGVSYQFSIRQLPRFTLWKMPQAEQDGYVTGLEPGLNFPNPKSFEKQHGRVASLAPGETRRFDLSIEVHSNADAVAASQEAIAAIQGGTTPEIDRHPDLNWSFC
ncbi:MAG: aldose 1-epimerase family protein [Thermoguttaceae bacterium]